MNAESEARTTEDFGGKVVVITGAAGLIGGWIADAFWRAGATLLLVDRNVEPLEREMRRKRWGEGKAYVQQAELRDSDSLGALRDRVRDDWGAPDVVINNAGIYPYTSLLELGLGEWTAVMETNVTAPFQIIKDMASLMISDGREGSMVNVVSAKATTVSRDTVAYSVSKAALAMLTRGAALELAPHGIRVNAVAPGFVPGSQANADRSEYVERVVASIPLGRASGPLDAPEMMVFLCSKKAAFVTGALIPVDGGRLAGPVTQEFRQ